MDETDLFALYPRVTGSLLVYILTAPAAPVPGGPPWLPKFLECFASGLSRDLQALAHRQPNIEVELLEAPHLAPLTHPRALAQHINSFLDAHMR
ncbi:alpha/beta fold hydrolase [Archangium gephyra]|uniref:alpha/beta fold hydrolase n=1 Tax=Archangium gephyra TaxID=48 RepID=UPI003B7D611C